VGVGHVVGQGLLIACGLGCSIAIALLEVPEKAVLLEEELQIGCVWAELLQLGEGGIVEGLSRAPGVDAVQGVGSEPLVKGGEEAAAGRA
jgi:hypothetical protein